MLVSKKNYNFEILFYFLENKNFFLLSKNFKIKIFNNYYIQFLNFYFLKDRFDSYWIFILKEKKFLVLANFFAKLIFFKFLYFYCCFIKFAAYVAIGLGFRKKYSKRKKFYRINIGAGKWVIMKCIPSFFYFNTRRRSIYLLTDTKYKLKRFLNAVKYLKKEVQFKTKGVMIYNRLWVRRHVPRSILFARRIKFRKIKIKLTKKQKQRK